MIVANKFSAKFYLYNFLFVLGVTIISVGVLAEFIEEIHREHINAGAYFLPLVILAVIGGGTYIIRTIIKKLPPIQVDEKGISFGTERHEWVDLVNIRFNGIGDAGWYLPYCDVMTLEFTGTKVINIYSIVYKNGWKVKSYIKYVIIDKGEMLPAPVQSVKSPEFKDQIFKNFRGCFPLSYRGIFLIGVTGLFVILGFEDNDYRFAIWTGVILLLLTLPFSFYFRISGKYFVIENHLMPWYQKIYHKADLIEIVFEAGGRRTPNKLWLITKDYKVRTYWAASLYTKHWKALKDTLKYSKINVRDKDVL